MINIVQRYPLYPIIKVFSDLL